VENFNATGLQIAYGGGADIQREPLYLFDCIYYLGSENQIRHDGIINELSTFVKLCIPNAITKKDNLPTLQGNPLKSDLTIRHGNIRYILDITFCEPDAPSYRAVATAKDRSDKYTAAFPTSFDSQS
jgi:hypothetical protein